MEVLITVLCSVMILLSVFLVVAVLMQSGKDNRLSGTIAGGAETFFGKTKGKTIDRVLSKATTIVSIIFVILVLLVYVFSGIVSDNKKADSGKDTATKQEEVVTEKEDKAESEPATEETETAETVTAEN